MIEDADLTDDAGVSALADFFAVTEHRVCEVQVVSVSGAVDLLTAPHLTEAINTAAARKPAGVIVDLSTVDFLASAGISALIAAHNELTPSARFGVVADGPSTSRPLKLLGIDTLIPLYGTLNDALKDLCDGDAAVRSEFGAEQPSVSRQVVRHADDGGLMAGSGP